jgi:hypothetical protein
MLPRRFDDITADHILSLVTDKISERKVLEYKQDLTIGGVDEKAEFLADVSSFANASGGDIIYGISDERDASKKSTGLPDAITPLAIGSPATVCGQIEQLIESGIQPRIPLVHIKHFDIPNHGLVIVVRVGKSWIAPHMVSYANRTRFFSRNSSTGKVQLDVQQIGAAFAQQRGLGERIRSWKTGRISKALAGEGPVRLEGRPTVLFHFISAAVLTDEQSLPRAFETNRFVGAHPLMSLSTEYFRYNADGLVMSSKRTTNGGQSYLQIFREDHLEYGDSYSLDSDKSGHVASGSLEEKIRLTFERALPFLEFLNVAEPIFVTLTLIGVKGLVMWLPHSAETWTSKSEPFDRDIIICPDMLIQNLNEGPPYPSTLLPIIDAVWQGAGRERTPYDWQIRT